MRKMCLAVFVFASASVFQPTVNAQTTNLQETLNQYVSDLQKHPDDSTLREKVIRHAQTMRPAPAVPVEAEKFEGRAEFAIKNAKNAQDFLDAAKEYEKALRIAPWVADDYFNQGIAYEKGGKLKEATQSFEFYLLAAPNAKDAREVRKRIAGLEYALEKAANESGPAVIAENSQSPFEALLKKINGRRYLSAPVSGGDRAVIDVRGRFFVLGFILNGTYSEAGAGTTPSGPIEIRGRETTIPIHHDIFTGWISNTYIISEDGDSIIGRSSWASGEVQESIYLWQR